MTARNGWPNSKTGYFVVAHLSCSLGGLLVGSFSEATGMVGLMDLELRFGITRSIIIRLDDVCYVRFALSD